MKCSECKYGEYDDCIVEETICCNRRCPKYAHCFIDLDFDCEYGEPTAIAAAPTNFFTEPKMELYSVVYKIDTDEGHMTKEYLVNATSQERALELAMNYFKNTAQYDESIVGDPIVHVLRKEGVISSSQVGCY